MSGVLDLSGLCAFSARNAVVSQMSPPREATARDFLWYLATPYTHPSHVEKDVRAMLATFMVSTLLPAGLNVFSPISSYHAASQYMQAHEAPSHAEWMDICYGVLDRCDGVIVSTMDGWWESKGVQLDIKRWKATNGMKRLLYASPIQPGFPWTPSFAWKPDLVGAM